MKGDYQTCLTHPKTGKVNCRQPEILIDGGHRSVKSGDDNNGKSKKDKISIPQVWEHQGG